MANKKICVVLAGCGVYDGAEIQEVVLTLLALERGGAAVTCAAPNVNQMHVINHLTGEVTGETRNVLIESARIARGVVQDLATIDASQFDGIILPGGFGVAKNLCTFAVDGALCSVNPDIERVLLDFAAAKKVIGGLCIAPALLAKVLGSSGVTVTVGTDEGTAAEIEKTGAKHQALPVDGVSIDTTHKVVTTPAYMLGRSVGEVAVGVEKMVAEFLRLA